MNVSKSARLIVLFLLMSLSFYSFSHVKITSVKGEDSSGPLIDIEIVAFVAPGSDMNELYSIINYLTNWGGHVTIAEISGSAVPNSIPMTEVSVSNYDVLLIPGGDGPAELIQSQLVLDLVNEAQSLNLVLAAICHGPLVLAEADVINGTTVTGYWEIEENLINAGAIYINTDVIVDGNIVTANWPYFLELSIGIVQALGRYVENCPKIISTYFSYEFTVEGLLYSFFAELSNSSWIEEVKIYIYKVENEIEKDHISTRILDDANLDGIYNCNYNFVTNGNYSIDIFIKDIFLNNEYTQNVIELEITTVNNTEIPTERSSNNLLGIIISLFYTSCILIRKRKN